MGVDYINCANCNFIFPDCGIFYICSCGEWFCEDCGEEMKEYFKFHPEMGEFNQCYFCTNNPELRKITDEKYIEWFEKLTRYSREDAIEHIMRLEKFRKNSNLDSEIDE